MTNNPAQSSVQIGGYDTTKIKAGESVFWIPIPYNFFWIISITGFRVGLSNTFNDGTPSAYNFAGKGMSKGIVDTGTSLFYIPAGVVSAFVKTVFNGITYDTSYYPLYVGPCDRNLYSSIFLYNDEMDAYLEITPENYVLSFDIGLPGKCVMGFAASSSDYWLLGDSFLRNFYTIWDEDNDRLGFAPKDTAVTSTIQTGQTAPTASLDPTYEELPTNESNLSIQELIVTVGLMLLGINAMVGTALLGMGTLFFGDFTKPVRRLIGRLFNKVLKSIDREVPFYGL